MKKLFFLLVMLNLFQHHTHAQLQGQNRIDSLLAALANSKEDTNKVKILNDLCEFAGFSVGNFDTALYYANTAKTLAGKLNFKKGVIDSYNNLGSIYYNEGSYYEALSKIIESLKINEAIGDKKGIAGSHNSIGVLYSELGNYPEALKENFVALKISEEIGDKTNVAKSYNSIGIIYDLQSRYDEALKNFFASLKISEEIGNKQQIAECHGNIGIVHKNQGDYQEALKEYFLVLKLMEENDNKKDISGTHNNIGVIYFLQGNYKEAINEHMTALNIAKEIGDANGIVISLFNLGHANLKLNNLKEGHTYFQKALSLAKEIETKEWIKSCYEGLATADSALGDYKSAFEDHKLYMLYSDSLKNEETTKKQTQAEMQYAFDKKEAETKLSTDSKLNKERLVRNGFVGGFAVVLVFAGVFFRQRNKTSRARKHAEEERLKSEELLLNILPHEVAEELKTTGASKAKSFTMVTVMFTDFKDFTTVSEKISAELLVDEIHFCFSAFDNILQKHNIEKIKTIGDAYLCAGGLPVSNHTHAVDMLNAAFEIRSFMLQRKKEKEVKGEIPFELRIGIHTGPVVAGIVGVKKYAYDIWGDTVNIAARMEQNSEAGKINISGSTYELVKDKFKCEHRGKIQAKNKGEIDMYFAEQLL